MFFCFSFVRGNAKYTRGPNPDRIFMYGIQMINKFSLVWNKPIRNTFLITWFLNAPRSNFETFVEARCEGYNSLVSKSTILFREQFLLSIFPNFASKDVNGIEVRQDWNKSKRFVDVVLWIKIKIVFWHSTVLGKMAYSVASFSFLSWQSYLLRVNFFFISAILQVEVKKHSRLTCPTGVTSGIIRTSHLNSSTRT